MMHVSVEDIQQNLIVYLQRVEAGETLVIVRAGQPVVEMKPVQDRSRDLTSVWLMCRRVYRARGL